MLKDEELIAKVQEGEAEYFDEIVKRYQEKLLRYAINLTSDVQMSQDIVQKSFIKAFKNIDKFDITRPFSSWIYKIVHNEAINDLKKESRLVPLGDEIENNTDVVADFSKEEMITRLKSCVDKLPLLYREPLVLHFFDDLSYEEISSVLSIPKGTVATRINRGKVALQKIFSPRGV